MTEEAREKGSETGNRVTGRLNERVLQEVRSTSAPAPASSFSSSSSSISASLFSELTGLCVEAASSTAAVQQTVPNRNSSNSLSGSNIGYQMLRRAGWREGTGLGASEQGRLDPVDATYKSDRKGIGAAKKEKPKVRKTAPEEVQKAARKQTKRSKAARKREAEDQKLQEQAFQSEFYREFWPENV